MKELFKQMTSIQNARKRLHSTFFPCAVWRLKIAASFIALNSSVLKAVPAVYLAIILIIPQVWVKITFLGEKFKPTYFPSPHFEYVVLLRYSVRFDSTTIPARLRHVK